ncbi:hypothetical protein GGR57DRAFT_99933 [Xylariaceae sp. FL1272]|nr:hypothetical protein GGR57DRAFT_99933 [Xylariaceae sp. FL1272]
MGVVKGTLAGEFWHNTGGKTDTIVESVLLALALFSTGLRIWSRSIQRARYQLNDWLVFVATFLMTARVAVEITVDVKCGVGLHIIDVVTIGGPGIVILLSQLVYVLDLLFVTVVALVKLSILHLYTVVFRQPTFVKFVYATIAAEGAFWIAALFATAFVCTPPQKKWYSDLPGHCGDDQQLNFGIATTDFILDIITFVLPLPVLWKLQLPFMKKVGLSLVFGLGFAIVVITAYRFKFFFNVTDDLTFTVWRQGVLSAVVPLLGIINANLPVMQPALKKVFGPLKMLTSVKRSAASGSPSASGDRYVDGTGRRFKRLPDETIYLSRIEADANNNEQGPEESGQIRVTTHWQVD